MPGIAPNVCCPGARSLLALFVRCQTVMPELLIVTGLFFFFVLLVLLAMLRWFKSQDEEIREIMGDELYEETFGPREHDSDA